MVRLTITTPDEKRFEADVSSDTKISQLTHAFLEQWYPPPDGSKESRRYMLRLDASGETLLAESVSLKEINLTQSPHLELVSERLEPDSVISLFIEDTQGQRFATVVLVNTLIKCLAEAFLKDRPGQGAPVVELVGGPPDAETITPLDLNATLYDEGVDDYATLRIYRHQEPEQE